MNQEQEIIKNIKLFSNVISIESILKGYRSRKKYKVTTKEGIFFVKIEMELKSQEYLKNFRWLFSQYQKLNIPSERFIDIFLVPENNCTVSIFEFLEGKTLFELNKSKKDQIKYGKTIAQYLDKLQQAEKIDVPNFSFDSYIEYRKKGYEEIKTSVIENGKVLFLNKEELDIVYQKFIECSKKISTNKYYFIHGDIKSENIIIDKNNKPKLIDIDYYDLSYRCFNIQYIIFHLFIENKSEKPFINGYLKELYKNEKKNEIETELLFILLADVIHTLREYIDNPKTVNDETKKLLFELINNKNHIIYKTFIG